MTPDEFQNHIDWFVNEMVSEMNRKNPDYRDANGSTLDYEVVAAEIGITPFQAWAVLANKHWRAILRYVRDGKVSSEGIQHRLKDLANYCLLGSALEKSLRDGDGDGADEQDAARWLRQKADRLDMTYEPIESIRISTPTEGEDGPDLAEEFGREVAASRPQAALDESERAALIRTAHAHWVSSEGHYGPRASVLEFSERANEPDILPAIREAADWLKRKADRLDMTYSAGVLKVLEAEE